MSQSFATVLEHDLRQLTSESRRQDGFAGWLTGQQNLDVKDAAERATLKLRSLSAAAGPIEQSIANSEVISSTASIRCVTRGSLEVHFACPLRLLGISERPSPLQEILRPFMLACESKHVGLVALGLACVQKMAANGAVHCDKFITILHALQQVLVARFKPPGASNASLKYEREPQHLYLAVRGRT
jgi:hypothetical protein